jgi:hypothetical protein
MFMGNRGTLHDGDGRLTSQRWTRKAWVTCMLSFKGRHRQVMAPGQYTELFFLDEVTALSAGHRPCATCRRENYSQFTQLWVKANARRLGLTKPSIADIDNTLHHERFVSGGWQDGWRPPLKALPNGTFVELDDHNTAWLVWGNELLEWSPGGYRRRMKRPTDQSVTVLTPRSIVATLAASYVPVLHLSARASPARQEPSSITIDPVHVAPETKKPKAKTPSTAQAKIPSVTAVGARSAGSLYKLRETPAGTSLCTYFAAILRVTGMDQGKVYPLKKFLGNFSGHVKAGRIQKVSGGYQLTPQGIDYFNDRYSPGSRQHVNRTEVEAMSRLIRHGGGPDWVPVD